MSFEFLYDLKAEKEISPGWYKLKWRPIKSRPEPYPCYHGTWDLYLIKTGAIKFKIKWHNRYAAHNGWGRDWERFDINVLFFKWDIGFYILWNIKVMEDGPMDVGEKNKRPIDISHLKTKKAS